jgi:hypothetical protein
MSSDSRVGCRPCLFEHFGLEPRLPAVSREPRDERWRHLDARERADERPNCLLTEAVDAQGALHFSGGRPYTNEPPTLEAPGTLQLIKSLELNGGAAGSCTHSAAVSWFRRKSCLSDKTLMRGTVGPYERDGRADDYENRVARSCCPPAHCEIANLVAHNK